jgi:eukaryotic-like serine/threonine-protein kinase
MSAVLREDPPELSETNKTVSPALERLVNHCLEKNPEGRFHSARDLAFALEALSGSATSSSETIPSPPTGTGSRYRGERWIWLSVAALLALSSIIFAFLYFKRPPPDERVLKFSILPPEKVTLPGSVAAFAVSPDGRRLAFIGTSEGQTYIWVRSLDSDSAQLLAGTDGALQACSLFWSPDSRFIGYFTAGKLLKVEASGSTPQPLCDVPAPARGGAWNRDGVIVFGLTDGPLYKVTAGGGEAIPTTTIDQSRFERAHRWPVFLPDGRHFLYLVNNVGGTDSGGLYVGDLDSKDTTRLIQATTNALYAPPGFLLFLRNDALMVQQFNADTRQLSGEPVSIVDHVQNNPGIARAAFSISENGVLAFRSGGGLGNQPIWFDRSGKEIGTLGARGIYINVSLSPDEKRAAEDIADPQTGRNDIWLFDLSRGVPTRFTTDSANDSFPLWSPDGNQIVFASTREGVFNLYLKKSNGLESEQPLLRSDETKRPDDWSHDGKFIIYESRNPKTKLDLWLLPMSGPRDPISFLKTDFNEQQAQFSPDGKWIAYTSDISGKPEVYVQTFPSSGGPVRVSTNGGAQPLWRGDGNELFYIATDRKLMAVEVKLGAAFEAKTPQPLFLTRVLTITEFRSHYAVTRDGQRFLVNSLIEETFTNPITVVVNWTTGLQR